MSIALDNDAKKEIEMTEEKKDLIKYLLEKNMRLDEFAKNVGITFSYLKRLLKGDTSPSAEIMLKIWMACNKEIALETLLLYRRKKIDTICPCCKKSILGKHLIDVYTKDDQSIMQEKRTEAI